MLPNQMTPENIAIVLQKQLGIRLLGDTELHLLGEMPLKLENVLVNSAVTTAGTTAGLTTSENARLTAELTKRKGGK